MAVQAERQRRAVQRYQAFEDAIHADHADQARKYIPGRNDPKDDPNVGRYSLEPMLNHRDQLRRLAFPEDYTPERERERQIALSETRWSAFDQLLGGGVQI